MPVRWICIILSVCRTMSILFAILSADGSLYLNLTVIKSPLRVFRPVKEEPSDFLDLSPSQIGHLYILVD